MTHERPHPERAAAIREIPGVTARLQGEVLTPLVGVLRARMAGEHDLRVTFGGTLDTFQFSDTHQDGSVTSLVADVVVPATTIRTPDITPDRVRRISAFIGTAGNETQQQVSYQAPTPDIPFPVGTLRDESNGVGRRTTQDPDHDSVLDGMGLVTQDFLAKYPSKAE